MRWKASRRSPAGFQVSLTVQRAIYNIRFYRKASPNHAKGVFKMFGLGPTELIIILIIALVIFGPSRLPKVGQSVGQALRAFRDSTDKVQEEVQKSLDGPPSGTEQKS